MNAGMEAEKSTTESKETLNNEPKKLYQLGNQYQMVTNLASRNAVVLFSMSDCCMCTVAKRLLYSIGVGPTIIELDHHSSGPSILSFLFHLAPHGQQPVPAIFIGGKYIGGVDTLIACHVNGSLVPRLKDAGALWL